MRLTVFSDGRCTWQCVPSTKTSPPPGPGTTLLNSSTVLHFSTWVWEESEMQGTILLNSSTVLHAAISFKMFLAVGSTAASILSITWRYLHTLVWSTPKSACSVPCVGLSFLRTRAHQQGVPEAQLAPVPGIRGPGFVVAEQWRLTRGRHVRLHPPQNILKLFHTAQSRRVQAGLVRYDAIKHLDPVQVSVGTCFPVIFPAVPQTAFKVQIFVFLL